MSVKYNRILVSKFGDESVLEYVEAEQVELKEGEARIITKAIGVNPVDTYKRSGNYPAKPSLPYVPGADAAGIIDDIRLAPNQTCNFKKGDRVYISGTAAGFGSYSQQIHCSISQLQPLSDSLSFEQGAAINVPYLTAYYALFIKAKAKAGERVLIHGASGGVGMAACQLAHSHGLTVFGTAGTSQGQLIVSENGAHKTFNHRSENYVSELMQATNNEGFDVIIEMLANVNLATDMTMLKKGARIAIVGNRGEITINPRQLMGNNAQIIGVGLVHATSEERKEMFAALNAGFNNGTLKPIVGATYKLSDASTAHLHIIHPPSGTGATGKMILLP